MIAMIDMIRAVTLTFTIAFTASRGHRVDTAVAGELEPDLLREQRNEFTVVQHPVRVRVDHGDVLGGLLQRDLHPPVGGQDVGQLVVADFPTERKLESDRHRRILELILNTHFPSLSNNKNASLKSCSGSISFLI